MAPNSFSAANEWADAYRQIGLAVVPAIVSPDGKKKHPHGSWKEFQDNGIPEELHQRWYGARGEHARNYSMGILCGRASKLGEFGLTAIDIDLKGSVDGMATWRSWLEVHNNGLDIETWEAKTGSGGRHLYFKTPLNRLVGNTQATFNGIDVRGQGGFVMSPPSPHYLQGKFYEWLVSPWETEIETLPDWLYEIIEPHSRLVVTGSAFSSDGATPVQGPAAHSAGSAGLDPFGNHIDGRDKHMADVALATVIRLYREGNGVKPDQAAAQAALDDGYRNYARHTKTRVQGAKTQDEGLEAEGRGYSAFRLKFVRYYDKEWSGLVANLAAKPHPGGETTAGFSSSAFDQTVKKERALWTPRSFPATDLAGEPPERKWLWDQWIPENNVTSLYGDGGVGKSLLAQQLGYAVAAGIEFFGSTLPQKSVLAAFCEDDRGELHRRAAAIVRASGGFVAPFKQMHLWPRVGYDNLLVTFDKNNNPQMSEFFIELQEEITGLGVQFLILDTAADLFGGNEIQRSQVNFFVKSVCGRFIKEANDQGRDLTVLLLAHPSVAGQASGTGLSGSTGWNNSVRSRLYLTRPEDGLPEQRILTRMKANYASSGDSDTLNLIWSEGILKLTGGGASNLDERTERAIDVLMNDILGDVRRAWEAKQPFVAQKQHPRHLELRMVDLHGKRYGTAPVLEAIQRLRQQGRIEPGRTNQMRGYKVEDQA